VLSRRDSTGFSGDACLCEEEVVDDLGALAQSVLALGERDEVLPVTRRDLPRGAEQRHELRHVSVHAGLLLDEPMLLGDRHHLAGRERALRRTQGEVESLHALEDLRVTLDPLEAQKDVAPPLLRHLHHALVVVELKHVVDLAHRADLFVLRPGATEDFLEGRHPELQVVEGAVLQAVAALPVLVDEEVHVDGVDDVSSQPDAVVGQQVPIVLRVRQALLDVFVFEQVGEDGEQPDRATDAGLVDGKGKETNAVADDVETRGLGVDAQALSGPLFLEVRLPLEGLLHGAHVVGHGGPNDVKAHANLG
jgi:hypothetical protein